MYGARHSGGSVSDRIASSAVDVRKTVIVGSGELHEVRKCGCDSDDDESQL